VPAARRAAGASEIEQLQIASLRAGSRSWRHCGAIQASMQSSAR
jgi:hypothetical protein